jgi:predicted metalloprotease with PDZ domain
MSIISRRVSTLSVIVLGALMYQESIAQRPAPSRGSTERPEISFTVSMPRPSTHLLEVEMRVRFPQPQPAIELKMPVWTPGSYMIREYARHVQDFSVRDAAGGELAWEKVNKNTWRLQAGTAREIVAAYKVYSRELTVRTNELNDEHAFWNNAALLMFPAGHLDAPSTVTVQPFGNWRVATGLPPVEGAANTYRADNFDVLYDSPFQVSNFKEITFNAAGKPHRIVVTGEGNYDLEKIAADTAKIAEEAVKIFGELPVDNYLIILNLRGRGGLEHMNSTALLWNRFGFRPRSRYNDFLALVAHEYFHLWNVKRIRPDALGPFDYENENYTKLLWVAEGATAYYEGILLRRGGLITPKEFFDGKATLINQLQARPGRFETSLEEASIDAWIKYYRQDENAINNQISYYDKGEIVVMMLDIVIRTASRGERSMDDVMRHLYNEFYKKGRNYTPADFKRAAETMAGTSLDDFFAKYVSGEAEIDYAGIVRGIGLHVDVRQPNRDKAYIGADIVEEGGRVNVRAVPANTPAYAQGLNSGDQIVAVDGHRIADHSFLQTYIGERKPGDTVRLSIFRFDKLRDITFTLGNNLRAEYAFVPLNDPTPLQQELFRSYVGADVASLVAKEGEDETAE